MRRFESQKELGENLKKIRTERGKTKKEIAGVMGISVYRYNSIEKGIGVFYIGQAIKLAKYYNISLDSLVD